MNLTNIRLGINKVFLEQTFWKFRKCKKLIALDPEIRHRVQNAVQNKSDLASVAVKRHIKKMLKYKEAPRQRSFVWHRD